jgi:hypothetical protein
LSTNLEIAKPSVDSFVLPCGYLDTEGKLHTDVTVREMTGREEEILAARNMSVTKKFNKIISNCLTSVGTFTGEKDIEKIVLSLPQGDRLFLLLAVRRVSLGDDMPFVTVCPDSDCKKKSQLEVDLSELTIKKMPNPLVRQYEDVLPKTKKTIRMKVLDGYGEEMLAKAAQANKDNISTAILARVESIDGKAASLEDILTLPMMDRNHLRDLWQDYEGGIDTDIEVTCPNCNLDYSTSVDLGSPGFFNPSGTLKSWKTKSST